MVIVFPIITGLGILAIFLQARQIYKVPLPNALSVHSLAMQAVVFMLVAVAWIWSLPFEYEELIGRWNWTAVSMWYMFVGWVIVDTFIFALGQAALLVIARRPHLLPYSMARQSRFWGDTE